MPDGWGLGGAGFATLGDGGRGSVGETGGVAKLSVASTSLPASLSEKISVILISTLKVRPLRAAIRSAHMLLFGSPLLTSLQLLCPFDDLIKIGILCYWLVSK